MPSFRAAVFGACTLCLAVVNWQLLRLLVDFAVGNATASHILLVPFITLAMLVENRRAIFASVRPAGPAGASLVLAGMAIVMVGRVLGGSSAAGSLSLPAAGLIGSWIGLFVVFFGLPAARVALFPLAFLAFAIPIPLPVVDMATAVLKRASTETVAGLFTLTGTPYFRNGFVFSLPTFVIEVADQCSGIRSSIALLLTGLIASHFSLRSWWWRVLFILAVLPIAVFKNGLRIATLSLLAIHWDPSFLIGRLHSEGGVVFYLLGLAMLAPILAGLRRMEETREGPVMIDIDKHRQGPDLNTTWSRRLTQTRGARSTREN